MPTATQRSYNVLEKVMDTYLGEDEGAIRKMKKDTNLGGHEEESILKKTHRDVKSKSHHTDKKIISEYKVTGKEK